MIGRHRLLKAGISTPNLRTNVNDDTDNPAGDTGIADQTLVPLSFSLDRHKCRYGLMGSETRPGVARLRQLTSRV